MAEAESKWKHTALLVIDMQVLIFFFPFLSNITFVSLIYSEFYFLQKDLILPYSPASVKGGEAIVPNVIKAVEVARSRLIPIIWVYHEQIYYY